MSAAWQPPPVISIDCLKTILTPCQPPVVSHDLGGWQGVRMDAQAFLEILTGHTG